MCGRNGRALLRMTFFACGTALVLVCAGMTMPVAALGQSGDAAVSGGDGINADEAAFAGALPSDTDLLSDADLPSNVSADDAVSSSDDVSGTVASVAEGEYIIPLTGDEMELLARVISAEARGESFDGQVAVGAVILNRVESDGFPDSVTEVCNQPGAFCSMTNGQINIEPSQSCRAAAEAAARGDDPTGGAVFFYNPETAANDWIRSRPVVVIIGNHCFCV